MDVNSFICGFSTTTWLALLTPKILLTLFNLDSIRILTAPLSSTDFCVNIWFCTLCFVNWILLIMGMKNCCVPNCKKTRADNTILHLFPNPNKDLARFKLWTNVIGGEILQLDDQDVFEHKRVCHCHFELQYHTSSRRLSANAIPTLLLSGVPKSKSPEIKAETSSIVHSTCTREKVKPSDIIEDESQADMPDAVASDDTESVENIDIRNREPTGPFSWQREPETECWILPDNEIPIFFDSGDPQKGTLNDPYVNDEASKYTNDTHGVYKCNECHEAILGGRFTCAQCVYYNLCANCASERDTHSDHYLLRVPPRRPPDEVQLVLQKIRELLEIGNFHVTTLTTDAGGEDPVVKVEVKEEKEEVENSLNVEDTLATVPDIDYDLPLTQIALGSYHASNVEDNTNEPVRTLQPSSRESLKRPRDTVHPSPLGKKLRSYTARHRVNACAKRVPQPLISSSALSDTVLSQQTRSDSARHRVVACADRVSQLPVSGSALSDQTDMPKHLILKTLKKDEKVLINLKNIKMLKFHTPKKS